MNLLSRMTCCSAMLLACAAWAQDHQHTGHDAPAAPAATAGDAAFAEAQVIKADPKNKKVTLRHGEIKSLNMAPMTMDFHVKDQTMFAQLKPGSKIRFTASVVNGVYTVMTVEQAR